MASCFIWEVTLIPRTWNLLVSRLLVGEVAHFLGLLLLRFGLLLDLPATGKFLPLHFGGNSVENPNGLDAALHHQEGFIDEPHEVAGESTQSDCRPCRSVP